ncbi:MAG: DUF1294 domain-containing protein [Lachnospiraceae bacterium]|jgi:uncharacterized membrane protein YsdA (DUF1294 family)|nr:DUF1294 domain-containing protein [Lachnospiraceae bacterium]MBQ6319103.1 DUF1294 domain-containing protein [Lachnospiraceae bacterium]
MIVISYIAIYLVAVNLAGFTAFGIDKSKARRNKWRIPEATLFLFAIFGGSIGCLIGMQVFRHKTQKSTFYIGIPVILGIQLLVIAYLIFLSPFSFRIL